MVNALGAQIQNVDFVETGFTGQINFIVVQYSATNKDLPKNNQFLFQSNDMKVNSI